MTRPTSSAVAVIALAVLTLTGLCASAEGSEAEVPPENALVNPSFEEASEGEPSHWKPYSWRGEGEFELADHGRTGSRSVMIASKKGADVSWHVNVPVEPFSTYCLSGWIKTEDLTPSDGRGALLNLHNVQGVATPAVTGTQDWTRVETVFETADQDHLWVNCLFGGWGLATGKAWYDDVRLARLWSVDVNPSLTIDVAGKGEPISKYIYGQFIEHLGRCIYGGIWAEMLEDRKFYFPVTAEYAPYRPARDAPEGAMPVVGASPWQIVGPADSVAMVKEDSFVGEHTPRVAPGSGIRQRDLGLVEGKRYVGYAWLKPAEDTATVEVCLRWGENSKEGDRDTITVDGNRYRQFPLRFTAGADTGHGMLEIRVTGSGPCLVGTASLMPDDHVDGMRADTLRLLKELDSPIYRWPGGNFVSGYDWKDGVGDRDRRPPRKNPAWTGVEHNDFGIHEFMRFCEEIDTEPIIVVNTGLGGLDMALEELEYVNGDADTSMGRLRAKNGRPQPYQVKWWGLGNEMYGRWQLGHMPLEEYVKKNNQFAEAMRAADSAIKLVVVGSVGPWSEGIMKHCADHMDLISEHFYVRQTPGLISHVGLTRRRVRDIADAHRRYRKQFESLGGKDIRIALDEWNYWYGPHVFGELGVRYFLKDGLGVAVALNEFARNTDMYYMANYAQTVNVIGAIKTTKTDAAFAVTGLVLKLYRKHFGTVPVVTEAGQPLDAQAALTPDGKLTVAIVNPTMEALELPLTVRGAKLAGTGRLWQIAGSDPMAYNEPGKEPKVTIGESAVEGLSEKLVVEPCSISLYALDLE
ncbi:MAG: alpha-L-arabinofuranosidase C-terminal domain-containing protein [Planctomycetota bacterium]|jgi:alpha-N-arabinofuranosidase